MIPSVLPISRLVTPDHERMVRAYLAALTGEAAAIDDLSQEVFLRAIERLALLLTRPDLAASLRGIARRVAHEHFRRKSRSRRYIDATFGLLAGEDLCVAAALLRREQHERLRAEFDRLPVVARRILELRYHDDRSTLEIARELGMSPVAVRVTLLRIRERLRRRLGDAAATLAA